MAICWWVVAAALIQVTYKTSDVGLIFFTAPFDFRNGGVVSQDK